MTAPEGAPFDAGRVESLVNLCLGAIVSAAADFAPAIVLPSRQIAGAGVIPYDCAEVFATVMTVTTGTPEPGRASSSGVSTWPSFATGANYTMFNAVIQLGIVRDSAEGMTGLGQNAPAPSAYGANLGTASGDIAILMAAISQIQDAQMTASPTTETPSASRGALIATTARITVLV